MKTYTFILLLLSLVSVANAQGLYPSRHIGSYYNSFSYNNTQDTRNLSDRYQGSSFNSANDAIYSFAIDKYFDITVSYTSDLSVVLYLVDSSGNLIVSNFSAGYPRGDSIEKKMLPPGYYYIVAEGFRSNGAITTNVIGKVTPNQPTTIIASIGQPPFTYTHTQNTADCANSYTGRITNDVTYTFVTSQYIDLTISHCGSELDDTYVTLLNSNGQIVASNNDYVGEGACNQTKHAYIKKLALAPGAYSVISEGYSQNGNITTSIQGVKSEKLTELAPIYGSVDYSNTLNTNDYFNSYIGSNTKDVIYRFTITEPMDMTFFHSNSISSGTFIYLLDSSRNIIKSSGEGRIENEELLPGTYYIISEGKTENGYITTSIKGVVHREKIFSSPENYILTRTYTNEEGTGYLDQIQYYDGLGRPNQLVNKGATPKGHDLVSLQEYDEIGRESNVWLPAVVSSENGGQFVEPSSAKSLSISSNNDSNPYSYSVYEQSPLNRILKKVGAGSDWQSLDKDPSNARGISTNFLTNTATSHVNFDLSDYLVCRMYTVSDVKDIDSLYCLGNYAPNELFVTEVIDENGNKAYEFKDKLDQVLLKRSINNNQLYDTYYVYDSYGNLRVVLPPKASTVFTSGKWKGDTQELKDYAYLYKYDARNRCIAKRIPGTEWIKMVYDRGDRMVFSQTGVQTVKNEWTFTIPDVFGRVVLTGVCTLANDSPITNDRFSDYVIKAEYTTTGGYKGYTIFSDALPLSLKDCKIYAVNYYDDYDFMGTNGFPSSGDTNFAYENLSGFGQRYQPSAKGLLTGTATARFNNATTLNYDYTVNYYDERSRLVQGKSTNHLGGFDKTYFAYNFVDKPVKMQHVHTASGKAMQTELYTYDYDHAGRLLTTKHKLNTGTEILLVNNSYDELGRLQSNSRTGSNPNLKTDYTYNVRSWMKTISNPHFNETLYYQDAPTNVPRYTRNYNGNISAMNWQSDDKKSRTYAFNYDNLSRLTASTYSQTDNLGANFSDSCRYDMHGNVTSIIRYGRTGTTSFGLIDNLTMNYKGNQLIKAEDTAPTPQFNNLTDFRNNVNQALEYEYDNNGNMTKDLNKGISNISYNSLNLPISLVIANSLGSATNNYTYSADGKKLKVEMKFGNQTKTTDYIGNMIYENGALKRILVDGGYVENGQYHFYIQDHLGNNRVVVKADGTVIQTNHYYPFGMTFMEDGTHDTKAQPYKYNGKEFDGERGLNLYDYLARSMDPAEGRFTSIDPLAEKFYSVSPYVYCINNPLIFIDKDGKIPTAVEGAVMAKHIYDGKIGDKLIGGWHLDRIYTDKDNLAYRAGLYSRTVDGVTEYTMANAGTYFENSKRGRGSISEDLEQPFGGSENMGASIKDAKEVSKELGDAELTFVGHSKGGAEAAGNALATNRNALLYNPAAINAKAYGLNAKSYKGADKNGMTAYVVKGDMLDRFINSLFAKPIDKVVYLPQQSDNSVTNHLIDTLIRALMEYYKTGR